MKICSLINCHRKHFARGYCHAHYEQNRITGSPLRKTIKNVGMECAIPTCSRPAQSLGLCTMHYRRKFVHGSPLVVKPKRFGNGAGNPQWKGGVFEYKNHHIMKKNRLIRFKQTHGLCETCGKKAEIIHHIDENKANHELKNLAVLCRSCHYIVHTGRNNKTSKFLRQYGYTIKQSADLLGVSQSYVYSLHKKNLLTNQLKKKGK